MKLLILLVLLMAGCELLPQRATDQINHSLQTVDDEAQGIIDDLEQAKTEPDPAPLMQQAQGRASSIRHEVAEGRKALPRLEDKGTTLEDWLRFGQTWAWVGLLLSIVGALMYLGLGPVVRRAFAHLGMLIPDPIRRDAHDDAELLRSGQARDYDHRRIARWQQADPRYRSALNKEMRL